MTPATSKAPVSAVDRLGFTLFMAVALHAMVIMGAGFVSLPKQQPMKTLEITLAHQPSQTPVEDPDFLAQAAQQGSGQAKEKKLTATTEQSTFQDDKIQDQSAQPAPPTDLPLPVPVSPASPATNNDQQETRKPQQASRQVVSTTDKSKERTSQPAQKTSAQPQQPASGNAQSLMARSLEIANLQAQIRLQQEQLAKRPRVRRLTSISTGIHKDAIYLDNWRRRIEMVGNLNYPEEAKRRKLYGTLRVMVAIKPDGSLKDIEILQSSGHPVLDDAAIRIVRLAAPFQPFSVEMRKDTDILEIIRTWKFEKTAQVY